MKNKWKIIIVALTVMMAATVTAWDVIEMVRCFRGGETVQGVVLCAAVVGLNVTVGMLIRSAKDE